MNREELKSKRLKSDALRILILEDVATDAELVKRELLNAGIDFTSRCADSLEAFLQQLKEFSPDLILAGYNMPPFSGIKALKLKAECFPSIPLIIVPGSVNQKIAVECMKAGAADYLIKENLTRLGHVVNRTLEAKQLREEKERTQEDLQQRTHDLGKRIKELNCLYGVIKIVDTIDISLDEIAQEMVNLIPSGWQYPDITCARIILEKKEFKTDNFEKTEWKMTRDITVRDKRIGTAEVYYLEEKPENAEGPFLKEERNLINAISQRLGETIEHKRAQEALLESEKKYRTLIENAGEAIVVAQDGVIKFANPKGEECVH